MAVAAVLEMKTERRAVTAMTEVMTRNFPGPTSRMMVRASRLWRLAFSTARATIKPPKNIITTLLMYLPTTTVCGIITRLIMPFHMGSNWERSKTLRLSWFLREETMSRLVLTVVSMPSNGKAATGMREVTASGNASDAQ